MQLNVNGTVGKAIAEYTGALVTALEVEPDPFVPGVFAVQAEVSEDGELRTLQFIIDDCPLRAVKANDLSEAVFTSWPPSADGYLRLG